MAHSFMKTKRDLTTTNTCYSLCEEAKGWVDRSADQGYQKTAGDHKIEGIVTGRGYLKKKNT